MELKHIVASYIRRFREAEQRELEWYRNQPSLTAAIETAGLAIDCRGKRQLHQRRLSPSTLVKGRDALLRIKSAIRRATSFDELHSLVEGAVLPIKGINELYIYDTALRIGVKKGLLPAKVYLHRGTREGARALGFRGNAPLNVTDLPRELRRLPAHEIEDILCIYKDYFNEVRAIPTTTALRGCGGGRPAPATSPSGTPFCTEKWLPILEDEVKYGVYADQQDCQGDRVCETPEKEQT